MTPAIRTLIATYLEGAFGERISAVHSEDRQDYDGEMVIDIHVTRVNDETIPTRLYMKVISTLRLKLVEAGINNPFFLHFVEPDNPPSEKQRKADAAKLRQERDKIEEEMLRLRLDMIHLTNRALELLDRAFSSIPK